jgi:hypothetical protein
MKRFWRPETGIFLGIWLVLMIGGRSRFFHDPGTFWHTVVGRQLLSSRELIYQDTFTFTFAGRPWVAHQWLGECGMALVDKIDSLDSLLLATVTILAAFYTWLISRLIRQGLHWSLALVVGVLTIAASSNHFHIRPHLATIVFLGLTYGFLCDFEMGGIGFRRCLWLVAIFLIWTNIHGGMLGGFGTMVLAVMGWTVIKLLGWQSPLVSYRQLTCWALLILACALTILVNPYGLALPQAWFEIMYADLPEIIVEHAPLHPGSLEGLMVLFFGLLYLAILAGVSPGKPRVTWLIPLVWFYLACTRIRHSPLFAVSASLALADMFPQTRWARWLARPDSDLFIFPQPSLAATRKEAHPFTPYLLPSAAAIGALVLLIYRIPATVIAFGPLELASPGHGCAKLDPEYWPAEVLPDLERYQSTATPIFNEYLFGGFLIYYTPGYRVFVDDRCELFGYQWLNEYVEVERGKREAKEQFKKWEREYPRFDFALTRPGSAFDDYFRQENWAVIKESKAANLYHRQETKPGSPEAGLRSSEP